MKGFYKQTKGGEWLYSPDSIMNKNYTLLSEEKDTYRLPIDGWDWYDVSPVIINKFELWENRLSSITELKERAKESSLLIPFSDFYDDNVDDISDFIKTGSDGFLTTCRDSDAKWLDYRVDDSSDSPREVLISTLEPLVI